MPVLKEDAAIHSSSLARFVNGSYVRIINFPSSKCLPVEETIKRANENLKKKNYGLVFNDCDHFATWCLKTNP